MTYNLSAIYTGNIIDMSNGLITQSNFVVLDGLLLAVFIVLLFVMNASSNNTKTSLFISGTVTAIISAIISFTMAAQGYPAATLSQYSARTLVWFAVAFLALMWNILS